MREPYPIHCTVSSVLVRWVILSTGLLFSSACSAASLSAAEASPKEKPQVRIGTTTLERQPRAPRVLEGRAIDGFPAAVVDSNPMVRVLRGDFEPPDTLILAYEEEWLPAVEQMVHAAHGQARVLLLVQPNQTHTSHLLRLISLPQVEILRRKTDSPWVRDYGPLQTYELEVGPVWLDFAYGWDRPLDDAMPAALSKLLRARLEAPSFALDGGAVVSNGEGLCAITRTSLIDAGFGEFELDGLETFLASLGCRATAILPTIPQESTGHADVIAQFLAPNLAMVAWTDPETDRELSQAFDQSADALATAAELGEYSLQVVRIPITASGETFYSYVNAARLRSRLLVPRFNDVPEELELSAYATLEAALPDVALYPIDADTMVQLGGAVHCVTLGLGSAPNRELLHRARRARRSKSARRG